MTDENATYQKSVTGKPLALEQRGALSDGRRQSPSIARNRDVLRDTFLGHGLTKGRVLEIASGTGEHGVHILDQAPNLFWTYSDIDPVSLDSQRAWAAASDFGGRLSGPLVVDASKAHWGEAETRWDAMVCINMIHIAPFPACAGLIAGAARLLEPSGLLFLYGPFARNGAIADSNARFDADLKRRDPSWGVRDLDRQLLPLADAHGLRLDTVVEMPANNLSVTFRRH